MWKKLLLLKKNHGFHLKGKIIIIIIIIIIIKIFKKYYYYWRNGSGKGAT